MSFTLKNCVFRDQVENRNSRPDRYFTKDYQESKHGKTNVSSIRVTQIIAHKTHTLEARKLQYNRYECEINTLTKADPMKKFFATSFAVISILALMFSCLPASQAMALKDKNNITIKVKNRTGSPVLISLVNENGVYTLLSFQPGITNTVVPEGKYDYYASTRCGIKNGNFNFNVTKQLDFYCENGANIALFVPHRNFCFAVWDFSRVPGPRFQIWTNYGPHCQDQPAQEGDSIRIQRDPGKWDYVTFFNKAPRSCLADKGPSYYLIGCPSVP